MAIGQIAGNALDWLGTAFQLPERGWSERLASGPTQFTGATPSSQNAGLDRWYVNNYVLGSNVNDKQRQQALSGDVLGSTDKRPNNTDTVPNPTPQPTPQPTPDSGPSQYEQYLNNLYSSLGSAYNKMSSDLNPMYESRKKSIEDMTASQLSNIDLQQQQGLDTLGTQREGVATNQVRNLKDLSNAISQSYNTFANQLGNMGAGDSSASRVMLPYALSRTEAQQRGQINRTTADKIGEINARETQLKNTVMQEKNNLNQAKMSELAQLGEWFDNAKMQISQMRLSDARAAGENALNLALQQMQRIQSNYDNRAAALDSWAISNSQNLAQLKSNLGAMTDPSLVGQLPSFNLSGLGANQGMTTSASQAPVGFGFGNTEDIFKKLGVV